MSKYLDSGVDINAADELVKDIKSIAAQTKNSGTVSDIGGFGAVFDIFANRKKYNCPMLVSSTDGVGTKLLIAQETGLHTTIGIDLVAMCANDVLAQGAEPMFFLDYFATGRLDKNVARQVLEGVAVGCKQAGMALIGGETAEMPGMYQKNHYDLAGFAVGIGEKSELLPRLDKMTAGDLVVGLPSSGLHSNGFSLVRKVSHDQKISYDSICPFSETHETWAEVLLHPTKIYASAIMSVLHLIKAAAHITGGGLIHNIPRVLPQHLAVNIASQSWPRQAVFSWLQDAADISEGEMLETFNCGLGMVLVVAEQEIGALQETLHQCGISSHIIGKVTPRDNSPIVLN